MYIDAPLDKVNKNALALKNMYHRVHVSPAVIFVHLQQWTLG